MLTVERSVSAPSKDNTPRNSRLRSLLNVLTWAIDAGAASQPGSGDAYRIQLAKKDPTSLVKRGYRDF